MEFIIKLSPLICIAISMNSCSIFDIFNNKSSNNDAHGENHGAVLGQNIGNRAGTQDDAALAALYDITSEHAPAPIRPDPDTYIRQLLRQYHPEGLTIAQQIGRVEAYRELLGGASEDFAVAPQKSYDSTSLLATIKVAEEICTALVSPSPEQHRDWQSILPHPPSRTKENIEYLAQRFIGLPLARIDGSVMDTLLDILKDNRQNQAYTYESYIPVCMTLAVDAEALLL